MDLLRITSARAHGWRCERWDPQALESLVEKSLNESVEDDGDDGQRIYCAQCRAPVTHRRARTSIGGSHEHVFRNPHGLEFHIGCFGTARGCAASGPATDEWTWFPGYSWQFAMCAACGIHLGWRYRSRSGDSFFGLILARLTDQGEGN